MGEKLREAIFVSLSQLLLVTYRGYANPPRNASSRCHAALTDVSCLRILFLWRLQLMLVALSIDRNVGKDYNIATKFRFWNQSRDNRANSYNAIQN
jgi:hypothetical protein